MHDSLSIYNKICIFYKNNTDKSLSDDKQRRNQSVVNDALR